LRELQTVVEEKQDDIKITANEIIIVSCRFHYD